MKLASTLVPTLACVGSLVLFAHDAGAGTPKTTGGGSAPTATCSANKPRFAYAAVDGQFTIPDGLTSVTRNGFVERAVAKARGCTYDVTAKTHLLLEFDQKISSELPGSGFKNDYSMQCVDAEKPNGKLLGSWVTPIVSPADGKSWTPPCAARNLNALEKAACSKDISNSARNATFDALMSKQKTKAIEVGMYQDVQLYKRTNDGSGESGPPASEVAPSGRIFCQYYSRSTKTSLFAFTFEIPKN